MNSDVVEALDRTRRSLAQLDRLVGWRIEVHPGAVVIRAEGTMQALADDLQSVRDLVSSSSLEGSFQGASIAFRLDHTGVLSLTRASSGDLAETFGVQHIDDARDAWAGDFGAASRLPGSWKAEATLQPARLLHQAAPHVDWYVFESLDATGAFLDSVPFWRTQELLRPGRATVFLVRRLDDGAQLRTPGLGVYALDGDHISLPQAVRARPVTASTHPLLAMALPFDALAPDPDCLAELPQVALRLARLAAGISWAEIATAITMGEDTGQLRLEFFGLQRVTHSLPSTGPLLDLEACRASVELARWATDHEGTDRLIATRQVASLQLDSPPWNRPSDIRRAAEPIFLALRGDAVAEALKAQREAKAAALAVAQRTAELTSSYAKGAIERCLASLLAVGGVIVARSTSSLTDDQAAKLRLLIAVILVLLAAWHVIIERPSIFRVAADHEADLGEFNELMSASERSRILSLQTLSSAREQAKKATTVIPIVYLSASAAALLVR